MRYKIAIVKKKARTKKNKYTSISYFAFSLHQITMLYLIVKNFDHQPNVETNSSILIIHSPRCDILEKYYLFCRGCLGGSVKTCLTWTSISPVLPWRLLSKQAHSNEHGIIY